MERDVISFRGERELWLDFVHAVRKNREQVWDVLKPTLDQYTKKSRK
ncbi:MAG: hypothetical protein QF486_06970 [Candidatus Woesearchaeota archaeon]|jgi:hypothetical protein|nr:hypothetical protein [Candidatus Woesearchaeota archaeon]MDP7467872.1 hypothetical protein [Candidatus Woesearchaeota archaeon]